MLSNSLPSTFWVMWILSQQMTLSNRGGLDVDNGKPLLCYFRTKPVRAGLWGPLRKQGYKEWHENLRMRSQKQGLFSGKNTDVWQRVRGNTERVVLSGPLHLNEI